jgi:hypothetical protein
MRSKANCSQLGGVLVIEKLTPFDMAHAPNDEAQPPAGELKTPSLGRLATTT